MAATKIFYFINIIFLVPIKLCPEPCLPCLPCLPAGRRQAGGRHGLEFVKLNIIN
jgi:hypothetical protein